VWTSQSVSEDQPIAMNPPESRLRFVKGVQEHDRTQASEGVDEGCQQSNRRKQTAQNIEYVKDETCYQEDR
jgi:hypothetical protein